MKIPPERYEETLAFYRDILGLRELPERNPGPGFESGGKNLWLDRADGLDRTEVWFEVCADDPAAAAQFLGERGIRRCDEVEKLPENFEGFWISNPAGVVHLVCRE